MYSVVLMMAMTTGGEVPDLCFRSRCSGCYGCNACYGCSGRRGLFGRRGCHGCSGGCYGGCYSGCYGGCYSGCYGGCYSGGCYTSGYGCYTSGYGCHGGVIVPAHGCTGGTPVTPPKKEGTSGEGGTGKEEPKKTGMARANSNTALVVVNLPAEAKLTVDGVATTSTGSTRSFRSPALETGKTYVYHMKAEMVRDGKTVTQDQEVYVRAGNRQDVTFDFPTKVASK